MIPREELKKLERKAKSLMLAKEIPQGKVDVVRSIMSNAMLLEEERYRAIIELLKNCPDKPETERPGRKIQATVKTVKRSSAAELFAGPALDSSEIRPLYDKRKKTGLFKIRYLAPSANRFGITFKKRLIPTKKLLQIMRDVRLAQDRLSVKLPTVMQMILDDPVIEDASSYNYLRMIQDWLMECPLAGLSYEQAKWMDRASFEPELKNWCIRQFAFEEIDTGTKEAVIQLLENKLRETEDLKKKLIYPDEPESLRVEKEKFNLECEKGVYDFIMNFRSFFPSVDPAEGLFSRFLSTRYSIPSLRDLSLMLIEGLVYGRETSAPEVRRYYSVTEPKVSSTEWNAGQDSIRRAGKDKESKRQRYVDSIRMLLDEYEEMYSFLSMRYDTADYVRRAFDEQWKHINKRRQDGSDIYERDFLAFLDECLSYFSSVYLPFLNGQSLPLTGIEGAKAEGSVFSGDFFLGECTTISNAHGVIFQKRSSSTSNIITRAEAKRIASGQIQTMKELESVIRQISSSFYSIGKKLQKALARHRLSLKKGVIDGNRPPLRSLELEFDGDDILIPLYDSRFAAAEKQNTSQKMIVGMRLVNSVVKDGIINVIAAFCFQFAQECFDRGIANDLEYRKDLIRKIEEAEKS